VHGESIRNAAVRSLRIPREHIYVVPLIALLRPPLDGPTGQAKYTKPNDGIFRILFFGRIYKYKGLRYLLEAMVAVSERVNSARLIVAGKGDDMSRYCAYISDPSIVEIRNRFLPRTEVAQLFFDADLIVLPYIEASQSGPLMIAMAYELPVVATDVGEMARVVQSTNMGLVVPAKDVSALASAICQIALDAELRDSFSQNAKRAMEGIYSRSRISTQVQQIYQEIIKGHRKLDLRSRA
jgi:glycosyltransferase involved in cell wall biosynthesis